MPLPLALVHEFQGQSINFVVHANGFQENRLAPLMLYQTKNYSQIAKGTGPVPVERAFEFVCFEVGMRYLVLKQMKRLEKTPFDETCLK